MRNSAVNYAAWSISADEFPQTGSLKDQIKFILRYGILAPSTHNTQPWQFRFANDHEVILEPNWELALPQADATGRCLFISLGACLFNLMVAADHFGLKLEYHLAGDNPGQMFINLSFRQVSGRPAHHQLGHLLPAINRRHSHKLPFKPSMVNPDLMNRLSLLQRGDAKVTVITSEQSKRQVAVIHYDSTVSFARSSHFGSEVSGWMRNNYTGKFDGMPGFTLGLSGPQSFIAKIATRLVKPSVGVVARKDRQILTQAPAIGLVTTQGYGPESWLNAGLLYQELGLVAALEGVCLAPKTAAIEAGNGQELVRKFNSPGHPQIYFGLGYGDGVERPTPRRRLEAALVEAAS